MYPKEEFKEYVSTYDHKSFRELLEIERFKSLNRWNSLKNLSHIYRSVIDDEQFELI